MLYSHRYGIGKIGKGDVNTSSHFRFAIPLWLLTSGLRASILLLVFCSDRRSTTAFQPPAGSLSERGVATRELSARVAVTRIIQGTDDGTL